MPSKRIAALAAATIVLPSGAVAAGPHGKRIARATDSGANAQAEVVAKANRPKRIRLQIQADPEQRLNGSWSMKCSKGDRHGSASGDFSGRAPIVRTLGLPLNRPASCKVTASGRLKGRGRIVLTVYNLKRG
jgi:hypothetical protein